MNVSIQKVKISTYLNKYCLSKSQMSNIADITKYQNTTFTPEVMLRFMERIMSQNTEQQVLLAFQHSGSHVSVLPMYVCICLRHSCSELCTHFTISSSLLCFPHWKISIRSSVLE